MKSLKKILLFLSAVSLVAFGNINSKKIVKKSKGTKTAVKTQTKKTAKPAVQETQKSKTQTTVETKEKEKATSSSK